MNNETKFFLRVDQIDKDTILLYQAGNNSSWVVATFYLDHAQGFFGRELCEIARIEKAYLPACYLPKNTDSVYENETQHHHSYPIFPTRHSCSGGEPGILCQENEGVLVMIQVDFYNDSDYPLAHCVLSHIPRVGETIWLLSNLPDHQYTYEVVEVGHFVSTTMPEYHHVCCYLKPVIREATNG